jgi:uncharacterized DUF497 family protein
MNYVWDKRKGRGNVARHGIAFRGCDPDFRRADAIGVVDGFEVTLIYTDVSETARRVISAWRAERHERTAYWQSLRKRLRALSGKSIRSAVKADPEARPAACLEIRHGVSSAFYDRATRQIGATSLVGGH